MADGQRVAGIVVGGLGVAMIATGIAFGVMAQSAGDDLSKLWSVFLQVPYALSLAYEAATVLIETTPRAPIKVVTTPQVQPFDERGPMPSDGPAAAQAGPP